MAFLALPSNKDSKRGLFKILYGGLVLSNPIGWEQFTLDQKYTQRAFSNFEANALLVAIGVIIVYWKKVNLELKLCWLIKQDNASGYITQVRQFQVSFDQSDHPPTQATTTEPRLKQLLAGNEWHSQFLSSLNKITLNIPLPHSSVMEECLYRNCVKHETKNKIM